MAQIRWRTLLDFDALPPATGDEYFPPDLLQLREDEVFVVNFSDEAIIDTDLNSDIAKMQEGLQQVDSRGGTALYDAVVASADYLTKKGMPFREA